MQIVLSDIGTYYGRIHLPLRDPLKNVLLIIFEAEKFFVLYIATSQTCFVFLFAIGPTMLAANPGSMHVAAQELLFFPQLGTCQVARHNSQTRRQNNPTVLCCFLVCSTGTTSERGGVLPHEQHIQLPVHAHGHRPEH